MKIGLIVSHNGKKCGVWQYGHNLFEVLSLSKEVRWFYRECGNFNDFINAENETNPDYIIFNHHPATLTWLGGWNQSTLPFVISTKIKSLKAKTFKILHLINQNIADTAETYPFHGLLCLDPTINPNRREIISIPRFVPVTPISPTTTPQIFTIGSFGFATGSKGFDKLCKLVNDQFDRAIVRINLPSHDMEPDKNIIDTIAQCKREITKDGIELVFSHDFLDNKSLVKFLSQNTINAFTYLDTPGTGISSCADFAVASGRPIALSRTSMFANFFDITPSVFVNELSLSEIAANGADNLADMRMQLSPEFASLIINSKLEKV